MHLLLDVIAGPAVVLFYWPLWVPVLVILAAVVTALIIRRRRKKK